MKRFFAAIFVLLVVLVGGSKIAVMIGASSFLSQVKTELVSVGALNFQSVSTSLQDSEVVISKPTFKHFLLKKDFSAEQARLKFEGPVDMMLGLLSALGSDYSDLDQLILDDFETDLPDQLMYEQLSENLSLSIDQWFSFLSCSGESSPTKTSLAKAGIENLKAQVMVHLGLPESTIEFDTLGFGRVIIDTDLLAHLSGSGEGRLRSISYIDNGYFKRLAQTCYHESEDSGSLSQSIVDGWSENLAMRGYRVSSSALSVIRTFIEQGGILRFSVGDAVPAPRDGLYGWQEAAFIARVEVQSNDGEPVALELEQYFAPPIQETVSEPEQTAEPAYIEVDLSSETELNPLDQLLGKQVRVRLFKEQEYEGSVKLIDEHQIEMIPLKGDGKVSYTFKLLEIERLEVWTE
jgi:hypothetical protein